MKKRLSTSLLTLLIILPIPAISQTIVSGVIVADDGTVVAAAGIRVMRGGSASFVTATTDAKGAFTLSTLTPGDYQVCVDANAITLLDPCLWKLPPQDFTVVSGQSALNNVRITVPRGYPVVIRVDDPLGILAASKPANPQGLTVGVRTPRGLFQDVTVLSSDSGGSNRVVYVPARQTLTLHVIGHNLTLSDQSGNAVAANYAKVPITHPGPTGSVNLDFQVK